MLLKCNSCGRYTLKQACPHCGGKAVEPGPAKYSPEDHYGKYRRQLKREARTRAKP
jgi:H/ACA ribonucleoprotein complex subunit 3